MPSIYKVTNKITNDFYIGKTTQSLNRRWSLHKSHARLYKKYSINNRFYNAVRKYDASNFVIELLEEVELSQIDEKEIYWIALLNPEYNTAPGGISTRGFLGKTLTEQHKNSLVYSKSYPIFQYDLEGNFIREWKTVHEARQYYNCRSISHAVNGKQITAKNFRWFKEFLGIKIESYVKISHRSKKVCRIDPLGNRVYYDSMTEPEKEGFSNPKICLVCQGKRKTHRGFRWEYAE